VEDWTGGNHPDRLVRYQLSDRLESIVIEVDESGALVSYEEYTPYGDTSYQLVLSERPKRFRWINKERDQENGFYYCEQRYYAPWIGRWTATDPLGLEGGPNLYAYAGCSPVMYSDPTGLCDGKDRASERERGRALRRSPRGHGSTDAERSRTRSRTRSRSRASRHPYASAASSAASTGSRDRSRSPDSSITSVSSRPIRSVRAETEEYNRMRRNPLSLLGNQDHRQVQVNSSERDQEAANMWEFFELHHVFPDTWSGNTWGLIGITSNHFTISLKLETHRLIEHMYGTGDIADSKKWQDDWRDIFFNDAVVVEGLNALRNETLDPHEKVKWQGRLYKLAFDALGIIMEKHGFSSKLWILQSDYDKMPKGLLQETHGRAPTGMIEVWSFLSYNTVNHHKDHNVRGEIKGLVGQGWDIQLRTANRPTLPSSSSPAASSSRS
jgi:RHS repeat-associated protein